MVGSQVGEQGLGLGGFVRVEAAERVAHVNDHVVANVYLVKQGEGHGFAHAAQVDLTGLAGGVQGDHTSGQGEAHGGGVKR